MTYYDSKRASTLDLIYIEARAQKVRLIKVISESEDSIFARVIDRFGTLRDVYFLIDYDEDQQVLDVEYQEH